MKKKSKNVPVPARSKKYAAYKNTKRATTKRIRGNVECLQ